MTAESEARGGGAGRNFETNVFVNCPFDEEYRPLLRALLFATVDSGFTPRIALEDPDSGEARIERIKKLIRACRLSIHDISRMEPLRKGDLPRFNMPFELGLDLGAKAFGASPLTDKRCLILERDQYRFQKVLSDISGNDIRAHDGQPEEVLKQVRNWLNSISKNRNLPGPELMWQRFNNFLGDLQRALMKQGFSKEDIDAIEVSEFLEQIKDWRESRE